jgi:RimJ/RimL family protein N-acetyltransferase
MHARPRTAPTLETPRLLLRGHTVDDFADCAAMWGNPDVTRHLGGRPFTEEETWSRLLRYAGHWQLLGFGYWVVVERESNRFVGEVGFADFRRDLTPSLAGAPEAGWVLAPWAHQKGFATEALGAATDWLDRVVDPARTVCIINEDNAASIRVAHKSGYSEWQKTAYHGSEIIAYQRVRRAPSACPGL